MKLLVSNCSMWYGSTSILLSVWLTRVIAGYKPFSSTISETSDPSSSSARPRTRFQSSYGTKAIYDQSNVDMSSDDDPDEFDYHNDIGSVESDEVRYLITLSLKRTECACLEKVDELVVIYFYFSLSLRLGLVVTTFLWFRQISLQYLKLLVTSIQYLSPGRS